MSDTIRDELLSNFGVSINDEVYERALLSADENSLDLIEYMIEEGIIHKEIGCRLWSLRIGSAYVDPLSTVISHEAVSSVPQEIARKGNVIPLYEVEGALTVAMPDPIMRHSFRVLPRSQGRRSVRSFVCPMRSVIPLSFTTARTRVLRN